MTSAEQRADELIAGLRSIARPRLIVISGPSGVGKDTVIDRLRELGPEIYFSVTATTRPRRPGEVDGVHYFFHSPEEFAALHEAGEFIESAEVYGYRYGVPRGPIRTAFARGQDVVVKVDPQGARTLRGIAPEAIFIFITPPSMDELAHRLFTRKTDGEEALFRRLQTTQHELETVELFDYAVFNETGKHEETLRQILAILAAEKCRIHQPEISI